MQPDPQNKPSGKRQNVTERQNWAMKTRDLRIRDENWDVGS